MTFPNVEKASEYALDIHEGRILAGKWVKLAVKNHISDLQKSELDPEFPFYFDRQKAERVCKFIQFLPHTKGKWAKEGKLLELSPWQLFFICCVFGWMRKKDDTRRYRKANLWVPRKNGKSALAAGIGNYMLCADGEYGAEVYSGATSEKQAWEVFRPAKIMIEKTEDLKAHYGVEANASNLNVLTTGSRFEPIIGNPPDGSSPHLAIVDEYHEHKDDRLYETMETGMGAREQPLMLMITTAGDNISGPCYQLQIESQKILEGLVEEDEVFSLIYTVDQEDSWDSEEALEKANPNIGVSVGRDFLLARLRDAKSNARKQAVYQTKHLNIWVGSREAYFNVDKWRSCGNELNLNDYLGREVYFGLDLASRVDVASLNILIPDGDDYISFNRHYLPESALEGNDNYRQWDLEGWLTITEGEIIDFNVIKEDILELISQFEIQELAYDPFQATMLITELMAEGVPVVEMRPTVLNFSEPMKALDGLIRAGKIKHNNDPLMAWMISNVTAKADAKDNVYPRKEKPENKIDGVIALLMALGRHMNKTENAIDFDNLLTVTL